MKVLEEGKDPNLQVFEITCSGDLDIRARLNSKPCDAKLAVSCSDIYIISYEWVDSECSIHKHGTPGSKRFFVCCCPICGTESSIPAGHFDIISGYPIGNIPASGIRPSQEQRKALIIKYLKDKGLFENILKNEKNEPLGWELYEGS